MKLKLTWLLTLFMAFVMQFSFAQEKTVTGTVTTASDGLPLPGASVLVKGTNKGQQTDFDGKYTIQVNQGDVLVVSYVGMKTTEMTVGASNTYDVALEDDSTLDEVVVVGYGTTTKKAYAGTATVVKSENIETKNFSNVSQSLAGEAAGVTVINTSGQPGSTSTIRIRGFGSVNGNRAPLYVVDGVPYSGSLNAINPSDIKSTTILKDATATAIYGSRGANGVILITTKGGSATESYIEVDVRTGINTQLIDRYDVITDPEEFIGYVWEANVNRQILTGDADPVGTVNNTLFTTLINPVYNMWNVANGAELIDPATAQVRPGVTRKFTPKNFQEESFNPAYRTEVNLRMGGGNEDVKYFISGGYLDDSGYIINSGFRRYTTRLNVNAKVRPWFKIGANLGYTYSETRSNGQTNGAENLFEFADKMPPIYGVFLRDDNQELVADPIFGGFQYDYGSISAINNGFAPRARPASDGLNPIASALYDFVGTDRHEVNGSFNATINVAKGLTFETTFGAQYSNQIFKSASNQFYGGGAPNGGNFFQRNTETLTMNFLQLLRYRTSFGNHSLEILAAHESNEFEQSFITGSKSKAVVPGIYELNNYIIDANPSTGFRQGRTLESYFGQVNYDFDKKYFLTGSIRRDGSSRFANDKYGTFGSVGAAWILSNEDFLSDSNLFTYLKLKGSYGVTGDENGVGFYTGIDTFNASNLGGSIAIAPNTFENPELTWETAKQYQVGVEFGLGNWLDGSIDYFVKDTENLIFPRRNPPSTGVAVITVNDGVLRNFGLEFDLTGHIIRKDDFTLDLSVNGSMYDNEITTMPIEPSTGLPKILDRQGNFAYAKGRSIYDFYIREYAGVDPADGFPMWNQYYDDVNGDGIFDAGDTAIQSMTDYLNANPDANVEKTVTKTYASATEKFNEKSGIPDVAGAFRLSARYKNWNLSTQFTYSIGGYAFDGQYRELIHDNNSGISGTNRHVDIRDRWRQPGDITSVPRIADRVIPNVSSGSTRFLIKRDYLALNNVLLGYTLSSKFLDKTGLDLVNLYVSGDNLFIKSKRTGYNPSTSQNGGSGRGFYAPLTTFTLGVKLKF
ncbi:putative outer membrane protein, probably involved in nutrient binding [Flavobacteriales bacterium ALC-1]|nr:putative outer membrane protein, probably involved in nutrient binding [Flavobacteriales bacterium ALC-1]